MYLISAGTVVTVAGYRGIVGCSGIEILVVVGGVPSYLVESNLTWRP